MRQTVLECDRRWRGGEDAAALRAMATLTARMVLALRFVRFSLLRANFVVARLICSYIGFPQYARLAFLEEGVGVGSLDPVAFRRRLFLLSPKKCLGKKRFSGISPPCLPEYPERPPKLHVASKKGLSEEQSQCLHTMLVEQVASLAREGCVMVFNLMKAAQEFLSGPI
ncbi:hypothetical protein CY35_09G110300 [Sphagnum magellanicum]|nr:hypothetical protein CY35_09G110300 [Sphagnum magellanicum]KAH9553279.1 hypothetical protein CY35_09G110300 [Sphagnum magellanicum]KAH9553280.1 hypothetical protein CY35_09G110300 [Sphagnum magellanicum]KAH9553281.1 hypothetical protein CY35_09G110300 [Sphagnum magellanicum]KAH9553282.1 hypothetical protein CY35_09G110300 [Sphagnum magellanicum]